MICNKPTINMLAKMYEKDLQTVYGNNLSKIAKLCEKEIDELCPMLVKNVIGYRKVPEEEEWRIPIITEMLFARENNVEIEGLSRIDINGIINYVCTI